MKDQTRIVVILDRSGSMQSARETTIKGFNEFVNKQKEVKGDATLKLVQFDDQYEVVFDLPLKDVRQLIQADFVPRGMTALLDAQGRTITELGSELAALPETERPSKIIFVTLTDGLENASTDFTREKVKSLTEHQTKVYGWEFIYLGANQDAIQVAASLGIQRNSAMTYNVGDPNAYGSAFQAMSMGVTQSRSLNKQVSFTEEERNEAMVGTTK